MRRLPFRRRIGAMFLAMALVPFGSATALAKMPFVSVEVTPAQPRADEPITIVARTWSDVDHTAAIDWGVEDLLDGLFVIRPAGDDGPDVAVDMTQTGTGRFEASISLPAGEWELVAFPDRSGWGAPAVPEGYPDRIAISVRSAGLDLLGALESLASAFAALFGTLSGLATGFALRP